MGLDNEVHDRRRIIVAVTGASGVIYGFRTLELLRTVPDVETHLVLTADARKTIALEMDAGPAAFIDLADVVHREDDVAASISSGSYRTEGMIIAPCSIRTLSGIANCYDSNLVVRAADVVLKERRRLVVLVRETPLHASHLRLMTQATEAGAIMAPPVPAFYGRPQTIGDLVDHTVARALDLFGLQAGDISRWQGGADAARRTRSERERAEHRSAILARD